MERLKKLNFESDSNNDYVSRKDFEDYKTEIYNSILNDNEVYKILVDKGFSNEDIFKSLDKCYEFYKNYNLVKNIKTLKDCEKNNIYYRFNIFKNQNFIELKKIALEPLRKNLKYNASFEFKDFDSRFDEITLKDVDNKKLKNDINKYFKNGNWIYIKGEIRTGKSFAAIASINQLIYSSEDKNIFGSFINCQDRFKELLDLYFKKDNDSRNEFNRILNHYKKCDFLVFDGFGNEIKNEILRDAIILPIIQERNSNRKAFTLFTSNYSIKEICSMYSFIKYFGKKNDVKASQLETLLANKSKECVTSTVPNLY